jgi:hypothetical protein
MSDSKSWEERFINRFVREDYPFLGGLHYYWKNDDNVTRVMDFIAQLLHQTRQDTLDEVMGKVDQLILIDATPEYNQGLLDAIKIIDKLKQQLTEMKGEV